jgi:hypothetical protein
MSEEKYKETPDEDSDRNHENERESLMLEGWKPLDHLVGSIPPEELPEWVDSEIEGEENEVITLARTKSFSRDGVQAWFMKTGRATPDISNLADVTTTLYFEDGFWHLEDSPIFKDN